VDALIIFSRFVHLTGLTVLFGGSLFRLCVQPRQVDQLEYWPRGIDISAGAIAIVSALGWLFGVAASMTGGWEGLLAANALTAVLVETRFGMVWTGRLALAFLLMGLILTSRRRTQGWDVGLLLVSAALTASLAGVGHGSFGAGALGTIHVAADSIHLLCAAAWLGALLGLALILIPGRYRAPGLELIHAAVARFSRFGYMAVGLLLVTGIFNMLVLVPWPELLITSPYGRILLLKIILVIAMVAIAVYNRLKLAPLIDAPLAGAKDAAAALYRNVVVEQAIGLLVIATVAVLGIIHPPL
jgi:putative copper resistance protein D